MRNITSIKVWKQNSEVRIYVNFDNNESGIYYLTGNKWHTSKSLQNMTAADLSDARKVAVKGGKWFTTFVNGTAQRHDDYQPLAQDDAREMQIKAALSRIPEL